VRNILILFLAFAPLDSAFAKCLGWEYGPPNLCATLRIDKLVRKEADRCYFYTEIIQSRVSDSHLKTASGFTENLAKKKLHLTEFLGNQCLELQSGSTIVGVIVSQCHDNRGDTFFGLGTLFRWLIGHEKLYADIGFGKTAVINYLEAGVHSSRQITCTEAN
jgi:hypothetical protein